MKRRFNRGYSLTEVVVSMALIVLVSVTAFLACGVAVLSRNNSFNNMQLISTADAYRSCFELTVSEVGKSESEEEKIRFVDSFTDKIAFCFGSEHLFESYRDGIRAYLEVEGEREITMPGDGLRSNGVTMYYLGADRAGITFSFRYECTTATSRIVCIINVRSNIYYFTVEGYLNDSERVAYQYEKNY